MTVVMNFDLTWDMQPPSTSGTGDFDEELGRAASVTRLEDAVVNHGANQRESHAEHESGAEDDGGDQRASRRLRPRR